MTWRAASKCPTSGGWQYCYDTGTSTWLFAITSYGDDYILSWAVCRDAVFSYSWHPIDYQKQGSITIGALEELQGIMNNIIKDPTSFIAEIILGLQ